MSPEEQAFWNEVEQLVKPVVPVVIEYRMYYNDAGDITTCSMVEPYPVGVQYIVVDKETYENYYRYRVVNGCLKKIEHDSGYTVKLVRSPDGYKVVQNHAALLLEPDETYQTTEYYNDSTNN